MSILSQNKNKTKTKQKRNHGASLFSPRLQPIFRHLGASPSLTELNSNAAPGNGGIAWNFSTLDLHALGVERFWGGPTVPVQKRKTEMVPEDSGIPSSKLRPSKVDLGGSNPEFYMRRADVWPGSQVAPDCLCWPPIVLARAVRKILSNRMPISPLPSSCC